MIYTVGEEHAGKRADVFAAEVTGLSRSAVARLMEEGSIAYASGAPLAKNAKLSAGDEIAVELPEPEPTEALPENIPLHIVYEDEDIVVVNKPEGMVVHPAAGNESGTLVNALLYHCGSSLSGIGGVIRPGIVHRIDKDTSGLLVVAKNDAAHLHLSDQLKTHTVSRVYEAIVLGNMKNDSGTVDAPIGRHPTDRKKMAVLRGTGVHAREAITHYTVVERFGQLTHIRCELETGRTHQIRVHMASLGHPLLGDGVYGGAGTRFEATHKSLIHGQCLHAGRLRLIHPRTGEVMSFEAPMPEGMVAVLEALRRMAT
ncbi:MAG: RluA family pseudouridine synthase [Clostridia bacterium]|nr:RluA family pseudouridine synthase [Clostridia bacterium]